MLVRSRLGYVEGDLFKLQFDAYLSRAEVERLEIFTEQTMGEVEDSFNWCLYKGLSDALNEHYSREFRISNQKLNRRKRVAPEFTGLISSLPLNNEYDRNWDEEYNAAMELIDETPPQDL